MRLDEIYIYLHNSPMNEGEKTLNLKIGVGREMTTSTSNSSLLLLCQPDKQPFVCGGEEKKQSSASNQSSLAIR